MSVTPMSKPEPEPRPRPTLDDLTAGEVAAAEREAGQSITTLGNERFPQARLIGALGWVAARRSNPALKFDHYMSSRSLNAITRELGLETDDEEADEEAAEGKDDAST